ncbi:hypothetical protein HPB48_026337 [Haemaphysalis longicornis]|uniref:Palmitoyltransferase n=1 Tax=Haemaphysalis longicornis TaxID=44386 RepID=A0A9J6H0W2_HAELO|nr:hypothetical protein HPB48_026337 [Haemaphysalis longicornis]
MHFLRFRTRRVFERITLGALYFGYSLDPSCRTLLLPRVAWFAGPAPIPAYFGVSSAERQRLNSLQDPNERRLYLDELGDKRGILTLGPDECVRYCEPCRRIKPDRCHHCTRCKKYVYGFNCCVPTSSASSRAHALLKISEIR